KNDSIFFSTGSAWTFLYADTWKINNINSSGGKLLLSETLSNQGRVVVLNQDGSNDRIIQNSAYTVFPRNAIIDGSSFWIADSVTGLSHFEGNTFVRFIPNSPASIADGQVITANGNVWVAAGSVTNDWQPK